MASGRSTVGKWRSAVSSRLSVKTQALQNVSLFTGCCAKISVWIEPI